MNCAFIVRFGEKITLLMKERRLTQTDVAAALDVAHTSVGRWCDGSVPHRRTTVRLAEFFGVEVDDLLDDRRTPKQINQPLQVREKVEYTSGRVIATDPSFSTGARQQSPLPAQLASLGAELSALSAKLYTGESPANLREQLRAHGDKLHHLADQPVNQ